MAEVTGEVSAKGIKFDQVPYSSQLSDVTSLINNVINMLADLHEFTHACSRSLILILPSAGLLREGKGL